MRSFQSNNGYNGQMAGQGYPQQQGQGQQRMPRQHPSNPNAYGMNGAGFSHPGAQMGHQFQQHPPQQQAPAQVQSRQHRGQAQSRFLSHAQQPGYGQPSPAQQQQQPQQMYSQRQAMASAAPGGGLPPHQMGGQPMGGQPMGGQQMGQQQRPPKYPRPSHAHNRNHQQTLQRVKQENSQIMEQFDIHKQLMKSQKMKSNNNNNDNSKDKNDLNNDISMKTEKMNDMNMNMNDNDNDNDNDFDNSLIPSFEEEDTFLEPQSIAQMLKDMGFSGSIDAETERVACFFFFSFFIQIL